MDSYDFGIQRHIYEERGLPIGNALLKSPQDIFNKKTDSEEWIRFHAAKWSKKRWNSAWCFLVLSIGTPRQYFLWLAIDEVKIDRRLGDKLVSGPGWTLNPPLLLEGQLLDEFKKRTVAKGGLQEVSRDLGEKLREQAKERFRPSVFDSRTISFLKHLAPLVDFYDFDFANFAARLVTEAARQVSTTEEVEDTIKELNSLISVLENEEWTGEDLRAFRKARKQLAAKLAPPIERQTEALSLPKASRKKSSRKADSPIVRSETSPDFWDTFDSVFGGKQKAAIIEAPAATKKKAATAKPAAVKKQQASGQGWKLSKEDQTAVDGQAMKKAAEFWKKAGYRVADVHLNHPYDLEVTRGDEVLLVEVKGTVGAGAALLFTDREMKFAEEHVDQMRLFVLSSIQLIGEKGNRKARGGKVVGDPLAVWDITKMNASCSERVVRTWTVQIPES